MHYFRARSRSRLAPSFLVGLLTTLVEVSLALFLDTTWEWDAATRAMQSYEISTKGLHWYFFGGEGHYVWLPLWQMLLSFAYPTGLDAVFLGKMVSCVSAGIIATCLFLLSLRLGASLKRAILVSLMPLTSGYYLAYASQAMTDVFSTMPLILAIYFLESHRDGNWSSVVIASIAFLLNSATRYEAWFFVLVTGLWFLWENRKHARKGLRETLLLTLPSAAFIVAWLAFNHYSSGSAFGFRNFVFATNRHESFPYYLNFPESIRAVAVCILLGTGVLMTGFAWSAVETVTSHRCPKVSRLCLVIGMAYVLFLCYSFYCGFSSGWARHALYLLPLASVSLAEESRRWRTTALIALASASIGLYAFWLNMELHRNYVLLNYSWLRNESHIGS